MVCTSNVNSDFSFFFFFWIQNLEEFLWQAADLFDRLDDLLEDLNRNDFGDDVAAAKHASDIHSEMKKKILKIPVDEIESNGKKLVQR